MPKRIRLSRKRGSRKPPDAVNVARPSKWGNPYRWGDYDIRETDNRPASEAVRKREGTLMAVRDHEAWLILHEKREEIRADLRGRDLACWCPLCPAHADGKPFDVDCGDCAPCHADTLGSIANP